MAQFDGDDGSNVLNGVTGEIAGFTGGTVGELLDAIGDLIDGLGGNDTILGGPGKDTIHGGDGDDTLDPGTAPLGDQTQTVHGGDGDDILTCKTGVYAELYGDAGDDHIDGAFHGGLVEGGAGADTLVGRSGFSSASLSYAGSAGGVTIDLAGWTASGGDAEGDTISGFWSVLGSEQDDTLKGSADPNALFGLGGNDRLLGRGSNDTLAGRDGNDILDGGDGDDLLLPGTGRDLIVGGAGLDTIDYNDQSDGVVVNLATGTMRGGAAGDRMRSIENVTGGRGDNVLTGNGRANALSSYHGDDRLNGGGGDDTLQGRGGSDEVLGGKGDDTIIVQGGPAPGISVIDGGDGDDLLTILFSSHGVIHLGDGTGAVMDDILGAHEQTLEISGIENVTGGSGSDDITGSKSGNRIDAGTGDDTVSGAGGNDTLIGYLGNDVLSGGAGKDDLSGGEGADTLRGGGGDDVLDGGNGADLIDGGSGDDTLKFAFLLGAATIDLGKGVGSGDAVVAGDRYRSIENVAIGFANEDLTVRGTNGDNHVVTGFGDDVLVGRDGDDTLGGYYGMDRLTGGKGRDTFLFNTAGSDTVDVVTDFGKSDRIGLDDAKFTAIGATLDAGEFRRAATAQDANDFILYDPATGMLWYDSDGNGDAAAEAIADVGVGSSFGTDAFVIT